MIEHKHGEYASIREVASVKDELLKALADTERRLMDAIKESNMQHDHEHDELRGEHDLMRAASLEKHAEIDQFMSKVHTERARRAGAQDLMGNALTVLRTINEFRWLIFAIIAALVVVAGGFTVTIQ